MGFYKDSNKSALPDMQVAISYSVLYNDYDKVDPTLFIKDIPTLAILNFVVELQNKVLFAISDVTTQRCMIYCGLYIRLLVSVRPLRPRGHK